MPGLRNAVASGNWSNSATWDGGFFPAAGDTVCANNFTVNIDQDVNVGLLTTTAQTNNGAVPVMTSNTTPSGIASANAVSSGNQPFQAFNGTFADAGWFGTGTSGWLSYQFTSPVAIDRYRVRARAESGNEAAYTPRNWTFEGWDGSSWIILHTVTDNTTSYLSPVLGNSTPYIRYRLNITAANGLYPIITEFNLYEYNNATTFSGNAGGGFLVTGSRNITCTNSIGVLAGSSTVINFSGSAATNMTLNSNVVGSSTTNSVTAIRKIAPGTLNINGNINITNFTGGSRHGLEVSSTGTVNVVGNVQGRYQNYGIRMIAGSATSTLNVTGIVNPIKSLDTSDVQIEVASVCNVNITGDVYGGSSSGQGVLISAAATVNITGGVYGGANTGAITSTVNHYLSVVGPLVTFSTLPNEIPAVVSTGTGAINIFSGPFISGRYGTPPFQVFRMHYIPTSGSYFEFRDNSTNGALSPGPIASASYLYAPSTVIAAPNQNNVRFGTVYASGSQTGQMRVPLPSQVSIGIPVDNTVGTAVLSTNDVVNAIWNSSITELTASNSIGNRLKNVSTPDITANQIIGLI